MNERQLQQLNQIDKEFERRNIGVKTFDTTGYPQSITIAIAVDYNTNETERNQIPYDIVDVITDTRYDIKRFEIKLSAQYMLAMLHRHGIYGVAIYSKRDEFDPRFGEFVSRARLLKHIKKTEAHT